MDPRLRALADLMVPDVREYGGRHEYDGQVQDLSPDGVSRGLAALGGPAYRDPHDEAHASIAEERARVYYSTLRIHQRNPAPHIANLDLASYDRDYAPAADRAAARQRHLSLWPEAIEASLASLTQVPAPVARATVDAARGLAAGLDADRSAVEARALRAHDRFLARLEDLTERGDPDPSLGANALALLLSAAEGIDVDLGELTRRADAERDRLADMLAAACEKLAPGQDIRRTVADLLADHPDADGVLAEARQLTADVLAWTAAHDLAPADGECRVGPAPESRRWAMAMMSPSAPGEPDGPSWYHVTPPDPGWPPADQEQWLAVFSRTTLPVITIHEVAPGHFSHGRALRRLTSPVRQVLNSDAFVEGWAHYCEEMALEEGFLSDDPRYQAGVAIEALVRVTRLACAIGLHTGALSVEAAARRFERDAFLQGPAALSEARRGTFDPTYGRYTWGKWVILDLRAEARRKWGADFSLPRFHRAMLALGSPPLGLLHHAL
jgi:Bacterial protein of unknown function (DUF885)